MISLRSMRGISEPGGQHRRACHLAPGALIICTGAGGALIICTGAPGALIICTPNRTNRPDKGGFRPRIIVMRCISSANPRRAARLSLESFSTVGVTGAVGLGSRCRLRLWTARRHSGRRHSGWRFRWVVGVAGSSCRRARRARGCRAGGSGEWWCDTARSTEAARAPRANVLDPGTT